MCGIVAYYGKRNAAQVILKGLEKLEYRGYDSAGLAVWDPEGIQSAKKRGRLDQLKTYLEDNPIEGHIGIGHTRWATHGAPSDQNAHPQISMNKKIAVVHNGIIENYLELKNKLMDQGYIFYSETDTEVVSNLIESLYSGDLVQAAQKAISLLRGSYALCILSQDTPDLYCVRKESPMIVGMGDGEFIICSDVPGVLEWTREVIYLENGDSLSVNEKGLQIYNAQGQETARPIREVEWSLEDATKEGLDHFMLKEIFEQPKSIHDTLFTRLDQDGRIRFSDLDMDPQKLQSFNKVYIVGCGTAYHAGLVGKTLIEKALGVPVINDIASEFRYGDRYLNEKTLVIIISQSGETADTLAALRNAKKLGATTLAITNVVGSSVAREAQYTVYTLAGPEISVASTKAYSTQVCVLQMLALYLGAQTGNISEVLYAELVQDLKEIENKIRLILGDLEPYKAIAQTIADTSSLFYLGRGFDYHGAMEGALKLKEISYIHCEAFAAGELKHGTIALIERGTPVIALATQPALYEKMISNIESVRSRGAFVIGITRDDHLAMDPIMNLTIHIPSSSDYLMPLLSVVPTQLIAYYTALARGNDVDKPRNLAKSVTVE